MGTFKKPEKHSNQTAMNQKRWKTKGVFLDLDGTLVDSTEAYLEAARIAFHATGKEPPKTNVMLEIPRRIERHLTIDDITCGDTKKFMQVYLKAYYSVTEEKTKLLPHVSETLQLLSEKAKLALITMRHCPSRIVQKELDYFGIAKYFTYVVTAIDTTKPKPSPEAIVQCVKALDVEMCECIIAGDSVNDIKAGKAAGARTVAVLSGLFQRDELIRENPDLVLPDVNTLPDFIE